MKKSDLIARLAERTPDLSAKDAGVSVRLILDALSEAIAGGRRIEIRGLGSFRLVRRLPRLGRNPRSGERIAIPSKPSLRFRAARHLGRLPPSPPDVRLHVSLPGRVNKT